jgi:hypothetical protein
MERKSFLTVAAGVTALAAASACAKGTANQLELVEPASEFNLAAFTKLVTQPADIRQVWDAGGYHPLILGAVKNSLNGYQFGFGIAPGRISSVLCLHGEAIGFALDDSMWEKYKIGASFGFKDPSGNIVASNIFAHARSTAATMTDPNDPSGMYQDGTIEALQRRGVAVFVCHVAAADQAAVLVRNGAAPAGATPEAVLEDLTSHLIPGAMVVPSAVATMGLLQYKYHYAYTTSTD